MKFQMSHHVLMFYKQHSPNLSEFLTMIVLSNLSSTVLTLTVSTSLSFNLNIAQTAYQIHFLSSSSLQPAHKIFKVTPKLSIHHELHIFKIISIMFPIRSYVVAVHNNMTGENCFQPYLIRPMVLALKAGKNGV